MADQNWQQKGLCTQSDPEIFFPDPGASAVAAIEVCLQCPVRAECLGWAIEHDERFGVWGGTSEAYRQHLRFSGASLAEALAESATCVEAEEHLLRHRRTAAPRARSAA
jgi:WhiB family transcriptional regulator, redox-sensing transcriptional regulator